MQRVLVVDDEEGLRSFLEEVLQGEGLAVQTAADGNEAAAWLDRQTFHLMITDLRMPGLGGMSLVRKARAEQPEMEVIVLTAHGTVATAVEAMKLGAFDYLTKPLSSPDELRLLVGRALERRSLREQQQRARYKEEQPKLVANAPVMQEAMAQLRKVAATEATLLLLGESGTGKEVAAQFVHRHSPRRDGPFIAVNCAAITEHLLESEMFGHEKGAFTGAVARSRGRFELADRGTLFLDEVGELAPRLQAKLLRVIQERRFERVGGTRSIDVDIRIVAATNRDLDAEMAAGRFREDLYHRLSVVPIRLPPLRDRPEDVPDLAKELLSRVAVQLGRPGLSLDPSAIALLKKQPWRGNVRELANTLERAAIFADGLVLDADAIPLPQPASTAADPLFGGSLRDLEREAIRRALDQTGGHRKQAAELLGIGLRTLYEKIKDYDLS